MILKELYIVSLKNKEVIKKYSFNEFGVNVILGVAKKDSNGVGKTAMIDSLRMVLGEKLPVDFKNKEELIKRDIMLVLKIQTEKKIEYLARQIIDEENGYVSDYLSMDIKGWDSYEIDDYRKYVQALVFEKLNGEDIPSLQAIREYLMRDEKIGFGDISLTRRNAVQNSRCLNFLSLIPVNYEVEINKLKKEQVELENEIKIIKTIAKDITRLKAEKIKLESEIVKIEKMLDSIDVCEKIDYDEEKYISAKKRLKEVELNIFKKEYNKRQFEQNIKSLEQRHKRILELINLKAYFKQLIEYFPEKLEKNYDDMEKFFNICSKIEVHILKAELKRSKMNYVNYRIRKKYYRSQFLKAQKFFKIRS